MKFLTKLFGKNYFVDGSAYAQKADLANYYSMTVDCYNCHNMTKVYIKKGVYLNNVITGILCSNCECRLEKKEK
jgi:hypothetical protein